ncbi:carbamoyltransferase HypF [Methylomonas sp. LW13]|uniref:carbamoyltransferase HypF n=1 Tax=unclassified Methylomonas TaxID=2608980 RepID=UPI00051C94C3|nr:carbamoyltransferase HypF [Methylomonas sp. LW13]QBC29146.1 carbamoyltransferase HypF [Methylomonas sp. LW13]
MPGKAIRARGVVQGVGFRPAIWHLAREFGLVGAVWNDAEGVMIHVHGDAAALERFAAAIPNQLPPLARLDTLEITDLAGEAADSEFRIVASQSGRAETAIAADAATCPDCLADIADPGNRRYRYPFTNCTHCGPRLSIVHSVPYDRCHTSMAVFAMCPECQREYDDPADRRFHAQANCCPVCGPQLWLEAAIGPSLGVGMQPEPARGPGRRSVQDGVPTRSVGIMNAGVMNDVIHQAADLIRQGYILAIKGLGGFHLACDASNTGAVDKLRQRKRRYAKPFALMARDAAMVSRYALINSRELSALEDRAAPIVLLPAQGEYLASGVASGDDKLGFMLPYTPLHSLLMQELQAPIVLTSGNISDEPQCIANAEAREKLAGIADYWLLHDRDIVNRLDDSVVRLMDGNMRMLRRARGYSPEVLVLPPGFAEFGNILAMGAELKNSVCLLKNGQALVSQHIGDLENAAVQLNYRHTIDLYKKLNDFRPVKIAVDKHTGYLSTQYGQALAATESIELVGVQHHHAHLAACLAEHGVDLNAPPVLAAIFDGLGMGEDGELWGGEFLLGDYRSYTRLGYFQPIALLGGAQAMREPWRNTYAQLRHYFDWPILQRDYADLDFMGLLVGKPLATLDTMLTKNLNSPLGSSCGRWFDAYAAALDLHPEQVHFEGQAAIAMEVLATPVFNEEQAYPATWSMKLNGDLLVLSWRDLWKAVLDDLTCCTDKALIAARIHHTLAAGTVEVLNRLSRQTGADCIVLSGGVFQNRLLLESVCEQLRQHGKTVLSPQRYPMNDGGLALGQVVIAAAAHG